MKRIATLMLVLFMLHGCAYAQYWDTSAHRPVVCCENRPGCQVLQAVMVGSFANFDAEDSLNLRVLSAALPRLTAITDEDFAHFSENFDEDPERVKELYYIALGNCLLSDIIVTPIAEDMDAQNARTVLNLFLAPKGRDAEEQMRTIRENCGPTDMLLLSEHAGVPLGFVEYLMDESDTATSDGT